MQTLWNCTAGGCVMVLALAVGVCRTQADDQSGQHDSPPAEAQLPQGLGDNLIEGLDDLPPGDPQPQTGDKSAEANPGDQQLLDQLEGEDIGEGPEDPLSAIARKMRLAKDRLAQEEVSSQTQGLQRQIVADLEALIDQLQKQSKQGPSSSSASSQRPSGQNVQQPGQQPDAGQQRPSNKPARESSERLGQADSQPADPAEVQALVKRVWGHLPDRVRQEMQNVSVEEFLPKYRQIIEDYFRSLAEEE